MVFFSDTDKLRDGANRRKKKLGTFQKEKFPIFKKGPNGDFLPLSDLATLISEDKATEQGQISLIYGGHFQLMPRKMWPVLSPVSKKNSQPWNSQVFYDKDKESRYFPRPLWLVYWSDWAFGPLEKSNVSPECLHILTFLTLQTMSTFLYTHVIPQIFVILKILKVLLPNTACRSLSPVVYTPKSKGARRSYSCSKCSRSHLMKIFAKEL